jgi:polyferredoxin
MNVYNNRETALYVQKKFVKTETNVRKWITYVAILSLIPLTLLIIAWIGPYWGSYDAGPINPWGLFMIFWVLFLVGATEWLTTSLEEKRLLAVENFKKTHPQLVKFL